MNLAQLEKHYRLLEIIDLYKQLLTRYDTSLRAVQLDSIPPTGTCQADRLGEIMIRKEQALEKLQRLQALADANAPEIEATIRSACSCRGRAALKVELAMVMRYQRGESWAVICDMLHEPDPRRIKTLIITRLKKAEEHDEINTGTAGSTV